MSLRIRGVKTELEEAGLETTGMAETTAQLQAKLKALTHGKVDIMLNADEFKNTTQILREMSAAWEDMTDVERAAALELMGGKRQANILASVITNFETVEEVIETSMNSSGSAMAENAKWMDSIEGKSQQLANSMQTIWNDALNSDTIKMFYDIAIGATKVVEAIGLWPTAIAGALVYLKAFKGIGIDSIFKDFGSSIKNYAVAMQQVSQIGSLNFTPLASGGLNAAAVEAYSQALAGMTAKQQAAILTSAGLEKAQIAQILSHNNVSDATIRQLVGLEALNVARTQSITTTVAEGLALKQEEMGKLSATASTWLLENSSKQLTLALVQEAIQHGVITPQVGAEVIAKYNLSAANTVAAATTESLKDAILSMMASNPLGWIMMLASALITFVMLISSASSKTEKLEDDLSNLKSEISSMKSEIDSLNSELETTQDRMAELLAMGSLSFTEQEELKNLKLQNAELERQLKLQEALLKNKEEEQKAKAKEIIASKWDGKYQDKAYNVAFGVISEDTWYSRGVSGKQALDTAIPEYERLEKLRDDQLDAYNKLLENGADKGTIEYEKDVLDTYNGSLAAIESGINLVLGDMSKVITDNGLSYSMNDDEVNKILDEYYAYSLKFANAQGTASKSSVISAIWDNTEHEAMRQLKTELDEIAKSGEDRATKEQQAQKLIQDALDDTTDKYTRLETFMGTVGVSAEEMANYFVTASEAPDVKTIGGILQVFSDGEEVLRKYKEARDAVLGQDDNGADITWNNLFTDGENGKEADPLKVAAILEGSDEAVREQFANLVEAVENEQMSVDEAFARWEMVGIDKMVENLNTEFESINNELFADAADEIDGLIDTVKELQSALESVAGTIDTLHEAQTQMNHSGRISVKTALELMTATDDWDKILNITKDSITLKDGAEQALIQTQLDAIKVQTQRSAELAKEKYMSALAAAEAQNLSNAEKGVTSAQNTANGATHEAVIQRAGLETQTDNTTSAELEYAANNQPIQTAESVKAKAIGLVSASIVGLDAAIQALLDGEGLKGAFSAWKTTYSEARNAVIADANSLSTTVNTARKDYERKKGIADVFANVDDYSDFKNYYDYDKTPGDKYADKSSANEFAETLDFVEIRLEEINEQLDLMEAKLENVATYAEKNNIIDSLMGVNKTKMANLTAGIAKYSEYAAALLAAVPAQYRDAAQNGAIDIAEFAGEADEITVKAIEKYREWAQKVADLRQQLEGVITTLKDLAIQKIDNIQDYGSAKTGIEDAQTEKLQNYVDFDEERGMITDPNYYAAMMENSSKKIEYWKPLLEDMQKAFDKAVEDGDIEVGSVEWYEQLQKIYDVQAAIAEAGIELETFQNAINDIYWENFDQLINRIDYLSNETQSLIDIMSDLDMVTKPDNEDGWGANDVQWTAEGLAVLGLHAQEMERAEERSKMYATAIDDLTAEYQAGHYSESEYYEKLNELTEGQKDAIKAAQEEKEAIVELNEQRIDAIKEGIEKEIEAYEELIEKKQEELSAEKDLYDFQKSTMEQQKNISEIQRKIAALSGDNSMAAVAKRRQLEAELAEAQADLQDSYYDRSVSNKQDALDKEAESFKEEKEKEIEQLDKWLEDVEKVVAESLGIVRANAESIGQTLTEKTEEYNLTVSSAILDPWKNSSLAIDDYTTKFGDTISSTTKQLETIRAKWQEIKDALKEANAEADKYYNKKDATANGPSVDAINKENAQYAGATKKEPEKVEEPKKEEPKKEEETPRTRSDKDYYGVALAIWMGKYGWGSGKTRKSNLSAKGFDPEKVQQIVNKIGKDGYIHSGKWKGKYHGITDLSPYHINKFAKGSLGVDRDQWAIIDELGEELQLVPGQNGRLQYIQKGTGIVPADITANLMSWGELDPQDMLDRNRPAIGASHIVHNEINITMDIAEVVHIDEVTQDTIPDLTKAVRKEMDSYMLKLNNAIKSKVR